MAGQAQVNGVNGPAAGPGHGGVAANEEDGEGDEDMEDNGQPAYPLEGIDGR